MKTLKEIKEDYAKQHGYQYWRDLLEASDDCYELELHFDAISFMRCQATLNSVVKNVSKHQDDINSPDVILLGAILSHSNIPS